MKDYSDESLDNLDSIINDIGVLGILSYLESKNLATKVIGLHPGEILSIAKRNKGNVVEIGASMYPKYIPGKVTKSMEVRCAVPTVVYKIPYLPE